MYCPKRRLKSPPEIIQEITTCAAHFKQNLCDTTPIPAMLAQCSAWELCMSRDPRIVGRARVGAEMLAEVINGFVEPISWKTLVSSLLYLRMKLLFIMYIYMYTYLALYALLSCFHDRLREHAALALSTSHAEQHAAPKY